MLSVSVWVFPGGVHFVCGEDEGGGGLLGRSLSSCKPCWWGAKREGGLNLCFIVVVLVIVWGIIFRDMCERGTFLLLLFYDMRTASCNGDLLKWPDYYYLNPTSEGLVYTTATTGNASIFLWAPGLPVVDDWCCCEPINNSKGVTLISNYWVVILWRRI